MHVVTLRPQGYAPRIPPTLVTMSVRTVPSAGGGTGLGAEIAQVAEIIGASRALVLSGAGMSTASGIPDYRGPDGQRRVAPMQFSEFTGSGAARRRYWARSFIGWQRFSAAAPNDGHRAVTGLQAAGHLGPVITQNVDGLHQRAGTRQVTELHGSLAEVVCLGCGGRCSRWDLDARMSAANPDFVVESDQIRPDGDISLEQLDVERFVPPLCPACGGDLLKPDVVFFGESVPRRRVEDCFDLTDNAEVLVVLGSSLAVMSGLRFVRRAAARGIPVIILTRHLSRGAELATIHLAGDLNASLRALSASLNA